MYVVKCQHIRGVTNCIYDKEICYLYKNYCFWLFAYTTSIILDIIYRPLFYLKTRFKN
jgi:hypothetical protein